MCGIAGFTHAKWLPGRDRIEAAVASIIHRGPDQQGIFESNLVSLGATRLKIIDFHSGEQPMISENGDAVIVFNGEIYNSTELRNELQSHGHYFRSRCDTETVLHAFQEWDTDCFSRLRGMFAIALWTESTGRLVLARDRLGIKPLYIKRRGADIFFGSELKAILANPEIDRCLSMAGLDCYLSLNYVPAPWTLVDGIEKLRPGCWLEWRDGEVRSECYWRLPQAVPADWTLRSAQEELETLVQQAVREHLVSDVPIGVWLSGGIDSSTILHYAANASSSRLKTFSISFRGRSFDESAYIHRIAAQYGTEHEELDLNTDTGLQDAIEEFAYYSDEPNADAGALPVWFLSKLTKRHATVALSGEGADELFGGYLTYRANQLARPMRRLPLSTLRFLLNTARRWPVSDDKISLEYKLKRFLEGCQMSPEQAHVYWNGTFSGPEKKELVVQPLPSALNSILSELSSAGDSLGAYLWFDQKYFLPDDILSKVDRMSMAHAVEVRPPFLDHRIVEFAACLPARLKSSRGQQKYLLKQLMKSKLPLSIVARKKIGFDIPAHDWLRGPLRTLLVDTLATGASENPELFRLARIDTCLHEHLERRANLGYHLWGLMMLFLWMKRWRIQTSTLVAQDRYLTQSA